MKHGKKPTRAQKVRLGQMGLSPGNWLVISKKPDGTLIIIHKHTNRVRVVPAPPAGPGQQKGAAIWRSSGKKERTSGRKRA